MMLGLVLQVVTLIIFGVLAVDVALRIRKFSGSHNASTHELRHSSHFKFLIIAIIVSYTAILLRCIYRIAEMSGGWANPIMQDQVSFIVCDGVLCLVATAVLNVFHPGFLFKESYATIKMEKGRVGTPEEVGDEHVAVESKV